MVKYVITERHYKYLIESEASLLTENKISGIISKAFSKVSKFGRKFESYFIKQFPRYFSLYIAYKTFIPGFAQPVEEFLKTGEFDLSDNQINLIISGIVAQLMFDSRVIFEQIFKKIDDDGLVEAFDSAFDFSKKMIVKLMKILRLVNVSIANSAKSLSICFMLPVFNIYSQYRHFPYELTPEVLFKGAWITGLAYTSISLIKHVIDGLLNNIENDIKASVKKDNIKPGSAEDYFFGD
jgi:hypothetical protein